jgi:hypothetical protein
MAVFGWCAGACGGATGGNGVPDAMVCTTIGCEDAFTTTTMLAVGMVPEGSHTVDVTADGNEMMCMFTFPPPGGIGPCPSGLFVTVEPAESCTSVETDAALTQQCQTIPGEFTETISVRGVASTVRVRQLVGGTAILDQTFTPTYENVYPNGPACGPGCREANAQLTLP